MIPQVQKTLSQELLLIASDLKCSIASALLLQSFPGGGYGTTTEGEGGISTDKIDVALLTAKKCKQGKLGARGVSAYLQKLMLFSESLCSARKAFRDLSSHAGKKTHVMAAVSALEELIEGKRANKVLLEAEVAARGEGDAGAVDVALQFDVELELSIMRAEVEFFDGIQQIKYALAVESPVNYLVTQKEESDEEDEDEEDEAGDAFDTESSITLSSKSSMTQGTSKLGSASAASAGGISTNRSALEYERLIAGDGLMMNFGLLDTKSLTNGLEKAQGAKDKVLAPKEGHLKLIHGASLVKTIRETFRQGEWKATNVAFNTVKEEGLLQALPEIQEEMLSVAGTISTYFVISLCRAALKSNAAKGPIGLINAERADVASLENVLKEFGDTEVINARGKELFLAVSLVLELRRAQKVKDLGGVGDVLKKCADKGIGKAGSFSALCFEELARAKIERENIVLIAGLRNAMKGERMISLRTEGTLDLTGVCVDQLTEALAAAQSLREAHRGAVLLELLSLADIVLKARKAVVQANWFALNSVVTLWRQVSLPLNLTFLYTVGILFHVEWCSRQL